MKKEKEQAEAERRQFELESATAQQRFALESQMAGAKFDADNYFREANLGIDREKVSQSAERLRQANRKLGQGDRALDQKEADLLDKWQNNSKKMTLAKRKQYVDEKIAGLTPGKRKAAKAYMKSYGNSGPASEAPSNVFS